MRLVPMTAQRYIAGGDIRAASVPCAKLRLRAAVARQAVHVF
jgi:hypothetical protein